MPTKICSVCTKTFEKPCTVGYKQWASRKVCSIDCRSITLREKFLIKTDNKTCSVCQKEFARSKSEGIVKWNRRKTCSRPCGLISMAKTNTGHRYFRGRWKNHERPKKLCLICNELFEKRYGGKTWNQRKCCSQKCSQQYQRNMGHGFQKGQPRPLGAGVKKGTLPSRRVKTAPKNCLTCGKEFVRGLTEGVERWLRRKTCSHSCGIRLTKTSPGKGPAHPNWKGGKTELRKKVQVLYEYKEWRKAVFKRDDYTCQLCGLRGGYLNADHIKPYSKIIEENAIISTEQAKACRELWETSNGRTLCVSCHRQTLTYGRQRKLTSQMTG